LTLRIKPVKLNQSIYVRVPNDIADLIGVDSGTEITLDLGQQADRFLLIYSMPKPQTSETYREVHQLLDQRNEDAEQLVPLPASKHASEIQRRR
jgi:antitoxin component of MazEF toxin-antitoxin module